MKIIRSFFFVSISLCATTVLHAQEVKADVGKPIENKLSSTSPAPVFKPQDAIVPSAPAKTAETPSPLKKEEPKSQPEQLKTEIKTIEANAPTNKLSAENLKTLNGTAEKPKQTALTSDSDQQRVMLVPVTKSVNLKVQEKQ